MWQLLPRTYGETIHYVCMCFIAALRILKKLAVTKRNPVKRMFLSKCMLKHFSLYSPITNHEYIPHLIVLG